jgi:hypothetical protein
MPPYCEELLLVIYRLATTVRFISKQFVHNDIAKSAQLQTRAFYPENCILLTTLGLDK